jgi:hypothetical protein
VVDAGTNHFLGKGVIKQVTKRREDINGTMFTEGDLAIAIEWWDRTTDEEGLTFERWVDTTRDVPAQDIINSTELRAASSTPFENGACDGLHFTMKQQATVAPAYKPAVRRSGRRASVEAAALPPPPAASAIFDMPGMVDQEIRRGCWLGGRRM